jgi:competence protein ComEC
MGRAATVLHGAVADQDAGRILSRLEANGAELVAAHTSMHGMVGDAEWRVLWPRAHSRAFPAGNDASVVLDIRGGGVPASLFLGDLSAAPQSAIVAAGLLRTPYELVKVAHHGSADQDPRLYERAQPVIAIVPVGAGNTYGHPRRETLEIIAALGARIARTDQDGLVAVWRTESEVVLWRESGRVTAPG